MNVKFNGEFVITPSGKPKGLNSEAAKAAFEDIKNDKSMQIKLEINGVDVKVNSILNESFLETLETFL